MTTIAWKSGELACDSQVTDGNFTFKGTKYTETKETVYVVTGTLVRGIRFIEYLMGDGGDKPPRLKDTFVLEFDKISGDLKVWESRHTALPIEDEIYAHGSGYGFAIGAMSYGASPREAVKVAIKHDAYTGGKINSWSSKKSRRLK